MSLVNNYYKNVVNWCLVIMCQVFFGIFILQVAIQFEIYAFLPLVAVLLLTVPIPALMVAYYSNKIKKGE